MINCISESQNILHTRGSMPCWRIVFSTLRECMSFYTWGNSGIEPYSGSENQLSRNQPGPPHGALQSWRAAMEHYVGLDVSLKQTAICIVDRTGKVQREGRGRKARRCGRCARVFPRSLCAGVGAALPTHDALNHHRRDAREHGLGHWGRQHVGNRARRWRLHDKLLGT